MNSQCIAAYMDPDIAKAIELMHASPETPWTVAMLADRVCLSRSIFAARFKTFTAISPIQYLLECRMRKACNLLTENHHGIKKVASRVGYATAAAFSSAFKRWSGMSPGTYRRSTLTNNKSIGLQ